MAIDTGLAAVLVTNDTFVGSIVSIGGNEQTREALDASHLGTLQNMEKVQSDLIDAGSFDVEYLFDSTNSQPSLGQAAGTCTITYPLISGGSSAANITGNGFWTSVSSPEVVVGSLMRGNGTITWSGGSGSPSFTAAT